MIAPAALLLALLTAGETQGPPLRLQYHDNRKDAAGMILPWSDDDPAKAYDRVIRLVWGFWQRMERCPNGVAYSLQHQVWKPEHDARGLGGDQISMALSSWSLHLLRTSSVVRAIRYGEDEVAYEKWDASSRERLKLGAWEPGAVEGGTMRRDPRTRVLEVEATAKRVVIRRGK
jgi:hypothetical protein